MKQGANILLFSKSLTPSNSMYTKKTKLVKPYFNFFIFSFVLWNSSFPAAGDESIIKKNPTEKSHFGQNLKEYLKFASQANSKHIFTGQKNSALVSLQFSRLATVRGKLFRMLEVKVKLPRGDFPEKKNKLILTFRKLKKSPKLCAGGEGVPALKLSLTLFLFWHLFKSEKVAKIVYRGSPEADHC